MLNLCGSEGPVFLPRWCLLWEEWWMDWWRAPGTDGAGRVGVAYGRAAKAFDISPTAPSFGHVCG